MKVKKQNRHRKTLTFYTACFGLRKPFKVLCDGTFVHHLLVNRITPADNALGDILSATVKLYTTRCVLAELKRLGSSYSETLGAAHKLIVARCEHDQCVSADACIKEVVGEKNSEHFFVASQDTYLRKKLQELMSLVFNWKLNNNLGEFVPCPYKQFGYLVCLSYGLRNSLFLESPTAFQRQYVKMSEEGRLHMSQKEYQIFRDRVMNKLTDVVNNSISEIMENADSGDHSINIPAVKKCNMMEFNDKPQFKRKRAKGPNPLSCKKKKSENQNIGPSKQTKGGNAVKRSRKRKRSHKQKMLSEGSS